MLTVILLMGASLTRPAAAAQAGSEQERRQIREDCHVEAEAAGLEDTALEAFVEQCVADLLSVELHNLDRQ